MLSYLTAFIFYTFAMVGILLIAFVVYKKFNLPLKQDNRGLIKIVDSCSIGAKKNLLIVKIENEKFLIASGLEHTTFLAKLSTDENQNVNEINYQQNFDGLTQHIQKQTKKDEEKDIYDFLYNQSKKLEIQKSDLNVEDIDVQKRFEESKNRAKNLYTSDIDSKINSTIDSRRKLMQELLDEIHQRKSKSGVNFNG